MEESHRVATGFRELLRSPPSPRYAAAQAAHDRVRVRIVVGYCALFYPLFFLLDLVAYRPQASSFLAIRGGVVALAVFIAALDRAGTSTATLRRAAMALVWAGSAGVSLMCALADGFASIYLVGVVICFIAITTSELHRPAELLASLTSISIFHVAVNLGLQASAEVRGVVSASFFLVGTVLFCVVGAMLLEHQRRMLFSAHLSLEEQNNKLERAYRHQTEFMRTVTHELRSPLNTILGFAELIRERESSLKEKSRANLERIDGSARRLLALINDILDLSKIEAGRMDVVLSTFELAPILDDVVEATRTLVMAREVSVEASCEVGLALHSDELRVRQILVNLAGNAAKFTHQGHIRVAARVDDKEVILSVADTGIGIPADAQKDLFRAFSQAHSDRQYGGTGLGLSIVNKLAELLRGRVAFESTEGRGTTFTVSLPQLAGAESQPWQKSSSLTTTKTLAS